MKKNLFLREIVFLVKNQLFTRCVLIVLFLFVFPEPLSAGSKDSANVHLNKEVIIYVSNDAFIYGLEAGNKVKIVHLPNSSQNKIKNARLKKTEKIENKKFLKAISKKEVVYKKSKSSKNIYDPFSKDSSNNTFVSKKLSSSSSSNNFQNISQFQNPSVFSFLAKKKIVASNTIFSYSNEISIFGFYQIFKVRPPPFS